LDTTSGNSVVNPERALVVAEALSWQRTPYHHEGEIKGSGVDCAKILKLVFVNAGLIEDFYVPSYPADWMMHKDEERYLQTIEHFARRQLPEGEMPLPGDIAVWRFGHTFSHGAIVIDWPLVIHAYAWSGTVDLCNVTQEGRLMWLGANTPRPLRFYSLWDAP
jgi:cell wall-associated NlpC family hydrolase